MPRQTDYTPEEDEIILSTAYQPSDVTNEMLRAAGFAERSASQIKYRRNYLRQQEHLPAAAEVAVAQRAATRGLSAAVRQRLSAELGLPPDEVDDTLPALTIRRAQVKMRLDTLEVEREACLNELAKLNREIHLQLEREEEHGGMPRV